MNHESFSATLNISIWHIEPEKKMDDISHYRRQYFVFFEAAYST